MMHRRHLLRLAPLLLAAAAAAVPAAAQEAPTIRLGRQTAAEDNLWLMLARPELAPNLNKAYRLEWTQFRASDATFKAFEGGQIDLGTMSANAALAGASKGVDLKIVASLSLEAERGAKTQYLVKAQGGPAKIADLKDATVGINGYRSSIELWGREGLRSGGLNPDRDVKWAVVPFSAMADAIRTGKIATGGIPDIFAQGEIAKGDLKPLFTSKTGIPFDEELIVMIAGPDFLKKHPAAVRAFLSDLVAVTRWYQANLKEARQALIDAKIVGLRPEAYMNVPDYARDPGLRPNVENLARQQEVLVKAGFQEQAADLKKIVDTTFLGAGS